ncbi:MAG: alpha/beta fold hydrolase [Actinomycetota bacterium]
MGEYLETTNAPVHSEDYGGSGDTILLVHGLGGSCANWDIIGPRLTTYGHVVAIDLPGFGLSPPGPDWSLDTHARAISDTIEHLGAPVTLIGNSMGGLLSEKVAAERPDLVEALVLISPATPPRLPDPNIDWPTAGRLLIQATPGLGPAFVRWMMSKMTPRELVTETLQRVTHRPGNVPMELLESLVELAEIRSHFPWAADAIPKTGQSIRSLFMRPSRFVAMIRDIEAPTLVIQGAEDPIVSPSSVAWMCSLRPDWILVMMEDTGHTPQIDAPIRTLSVLEPWLEERLKQELAV